MSIEDKIVASMLFSIALISVIVLEANLYTGKIGYVNSGKKLLEALIILVFNLLASFIVGLVYRLCFGINDIVSSRFDNYVWYVVLFKAMGTGILIYLAVELYKNTKSLLPVVFCIMAFILSGMYHCIADACYFATSTFPISGILYFVLVIVGNSLGSLLIRFLQINFSKN